jgi:hypothetical protein
MYFPLSQELHRRPRGEEALALVQSALWIGDRFFASCPSGVSYPDRRDQTPKLHYYGGKLTRTGLILVCDIDTPWAVLTPWGPWVFHGLATYSGFKFLDDRSAFMDGLVLGDLGTCEDNTRNSFYPVISAGQQELPTPEPYAFAGAALGTECPQVLTDEWLSLYHRATI